MQAEPSTGCSWPQASHLGTFSDLSLHREGTGSSALYLLNEQGFPMGGLVLSEGPASWQACVTSASAREDAGGGGCGSSWVLWKGPLALPALMAHLLPAQAQEPLRL